MRVTSSCFWRIISVLLLCVFPALSWAESQKRDEASAKEVFYGMNVGVDVLNPLLHLFNHDRFGVNADLQFDLWHRLYPTFVVGYDKYDASSDYDYPVPAENNLYKVNGLYFKVGAMYNVWRKNLSKPLNPIGYFGINYGCSPGYSYEIANYPIHNSYWMENGRMFSSKGHTTAQWGEVVLGVKAPIAGNLCLGFEAMIKMFLHINDQYEGNSVIRQSHAPGFGDKESGKWGFRYTISYFFHL